MTDETPRTISGNYPFIIVFGNKQKKIFTQPYISTQADDLNFAPKLAHSAVWGRQEYFQKTSHKIEKRKNRKKIFLDSNTRHVYSWFSSRRPCWPRRPGPDSKPASASSASRSRCPCIGDRTKQRVKTGLFSLQEFFCIRT